MHYYDNSVIISKQVDCGYYFATIITFRKLKKILSETPEPDDFEQTLADMKAAMR